MAELPRNVLKQYFLTGATPTQAQFADLIDSVLNFAGDGLQVDAAKRLGVGAAAPSARLSVQGAFDVPLTGTIAIPLPVPPPPDGGTGGTGNGGAPTPPLPPTTAPVIGVGTKFLTELKVADLLQVGALVLTVTAITDDTHMTVQPIPTVDVPASTGYARGALLAVQDTSGTPQLAVDPAGNIGVGTASPAAKLQVVGTVLATALEGDGAAINNLSADEIATGTIDAERLPDIDAAKIATGTLAVARLPDVDAGKVTSGTFNPARIPALDATKISGRLAVDQLPAIPPSKLSGPLTVDQLPSLPTTKLTGTLDAAMLPPIDASKIASGTLAPERLPAVDASKVSSGLLDAARIPNLDAAKVASGMLTLDRIPDIPASKVIGGGTGGGGAPNTWARRIAFYPSGLGIGSRVQAGSASGFFLGLVKTDTDQNRSYYALGIGFAAPLLSFDSPELTQAGVRANVYSDRTRYSLSAEGGVAGETVTRVQFVGVAPELGFELRTPEAQLPAKSQGKIASVVVVGTRAADPTASVGAADIINALRGTISPFSFAAITSPDTSVPPAVAELAVQLQAQGWIAPDAAPVLAALQPGAFAADAAGLVTLLTTTFTVSTQTVAQLAWSLAAAGISASVASAELGRFFAGRVSMTDLAQALAGAYPAPSVKRLVIQQQAATTSAQDAASPLAQASPQLAAPLPLGVLLRISFAGTASTPLQLAQALHAAGFTSQSDVTAAIQQLFPTTAARDVKTAVQQAYAG